MTPKAAYSHLVTQTKNNRDAFYDSLETLPDPLGRFVKQSYQNRVSRSRGKPMLGEWAPLLLADILDIKNSRAAKRVFPSWMNFYAYTLFIDDALDRSQKFGAAPLLLASGLLLERGIFNLYRHLPRKASVRIRLDAYFIETASAVMEEISRHKNRLSRFTLGDVDRVGQKVAFLKLCAAELLAMDSRTLTADLLVPIERLATGMQLLDDVSDWEEDWQAGAYSHLLTETFSRLKVLGSTKSDKPQSFNRDEVFAGIIVSGSLEDCVAQGLFYLELVRSENRHRSRAAAYILDLIITENEALLRDVKDLRQIFVGLPQRKMKSFDRWLEKLVHEEQFNQTLGRIERKLVIVATNS